LDSLLEHLAGDILTFCRDGRLANVEHPALRSRQGQVLHFLKSMEAPPQRLLLGGIDFQRYAHRHHDRPPCLWGRKPQLSYFSQSPPEELATPAMHVSEIAPRSRLSASRSTNRSSPPLFARFLSAQPSTAP
jgi:hypothetical protein